jgi:tRNA G46 methylase TrmB
MNDLSVRYLLLFVLASSSGLSMRSSGFIARKVRRNHREMFHTAHSQYHIEEVGVHKNLVDITEKHFDTCSRWQSEHTVSQYTIEAFKAAKHFVEVFHANRSESIDNGLPLILDSGCGTGRSSALLAGLHPELPVIGLDRSAARISKSDHWLRGNHSAGGANNVALTAEPTSPLPNLLLLRCDVIDFWLLAATPLTCPPKLSPRCWDVKLHTILYPNPYPKPKHFGRRWHGHPVFPLLLQVMKSKKIRTSYYDGELSPFQL